MDTTQRYILVSPSVLKPVYEYVKENNKRNGIDYKNFSYQKWIKKIAQLTNLILRKL